MKNYLPLIVEDDESSTSILSEFLQKLPFLQKPVVCKTAFEALGELNQNLFDMVFLDMHLPDLSGEELLQLFPKRLPTIITTSDPNFAVNCFDCDVADYLMKPFSFLRCVRAVNRALEMNVADNSVADSHSIFLKAGRQLKQFHYKDIDYVEAFGIYSKLIGHQQVTVVNETITSLEQRLPKRSFARVQKSYIVNVEKIAAYDTKYLQLGTAKIPIGLAYRNSLQGFWSLLDKN
jgi:DNA-binding LytR/AlgR family response regulator